MTRFLVLGVLAGFCASGQTLVDLRSQGRNVDFSNATSTRPVKTGATPPAACAVGDLFFKSSAPAGSNLYGCVALNTWTLLTGGSGGASSGINSAGTGLYLAGGTISVDFATTAGLSMPNTFSNVNDFSAGQIRIQNGTGAPPAATCSSAAHVGKLYARSDAQATGTTGYLCAQTAAGVYAWEGIAARAETSLLNLGCSNWTLMPTTHLTNWGSNITGACSGPQTLAYFRYGKFVADGEYLVGIARVPENFTGRAALTVRWNQTDGGSGNSRLVAETYCHKSSGTFTGISYNAAQNSGDVAIGATNVMSTATVDNLNTTGCAAGDVLYVRFSRGTASSNDYTQKLVFSDGVLKLYRN